MFLLIVLVEKVILQHNQHSSRPFAARWHWDEHVSSWINRDFLLPDHRIHPEVHLIVHNRFLHSSHINYRLLILNLSVVHLNAHEDGIIAAGVEGHHVHTDAVRLVRLPGRVDVQFFLFALEDVYELLFFDGGQHDGPSSWINRDVVT